VRHEAGAVVVRLGAMELRIAASQVNGDAGYLVVRSAAVALDDAGSGRNDTTLLATVRKATYLGAHWEYTLETEFGPLFLSQPVGRRFMQGASVALRFDPRHLSMVARS
jgi:hypothetical protein